MGWPGKVLLENVSFDIYEKQIVFIMGGSGCGKSTLMKTIIGIRPWPETYLFGEKVLSIPERKFLKFNAA